MTPERMRFVERNIDAELTPEEIAEGWHFCYDWDGLLVNRYDKEGEGSCCTCFAPDKENHEHP